MEWKPRAVRERIKITEFFTFFRQHFDKGYHFWGESHNFWELVYVMKGFVSVTADDRVYTLGEGSMIFHKPMEFHKFHISCDEGAELLVVSYSAEGELTGFFENKVFSLDYDQKNIVSQLLDYVTPYSKAIGDMESYIGVFEDDGKQSQYICLCFYKLLFLLAESDRVMPVSGAADSLVFAETVKYMNVMVGEMVSVGDFARFANVSVSKLKRIFLRYAGVGVHKYFMMVKFKTAAGLLTNGLSVTEVSERLGFSSQGYFSNAFKRENGYPPSEISKNNDLTKMF